MTAPGPCPFCGKTNTDMDCDVFYYGGDPEPYWQVRCLECEARGPYTYPESAAVEAWNRLGRTNDTEGGPK